MVLVWLLLGLLLALAVARLIAWFAAADPRAVATVLRTAGITFAVLAGVGLIVTGRLPFLLFLAGGGLPLLSRLKARLGGAGRPKGGQRSTVAARFLRMELDHDSGAMTGTVLEGPLQGRDLASLSPAELGTLYRLCLGGDPESVRLLEAWLDRHGPADWRSRVEPDGEPGSGAGTGGGPLTREEAYRILGLEPGAGRPEIDAAYRRLIRKLHPDAGGSAWLAARLNEARDLLLG